MSLPSSLHYTAEHLWVQETDDDSWLAGITNYAQDLLGDIVFLELPNVGDEITAGEPCGLVESVKTGSDLHAPMNGVITAVNEDLINMPEAINDTPYEAWIFKFTPNDPADTDQLLTAEAYSQVID